jgi:hypothetical protein
MTGFEPVPQGLEGPRATVTPHSLMGRLFTGPSEHSSCQRSHSCELVGGNGFEPKRFRSYRPYGDSARTRTRTHELWRLGCFCYTTLPMSPHVSTVSKTQPPSDLAQTSSELEAKTKKAFQGIALEGLVLYECRPI